jgi:hypothetical protein
VINMGSNRRRRAEKHERRQRADGAGGASWPEVIWAAVDAVQQADGRRRAELLALLAGGGWEAAVELAALLAESVSALRLRNWGVADLVRQAERRLGPSHAECLRALVAGSGARAADLAVDVCVGVEVFALLSSLPPLPPLGAAPRRAPRPDHDPRMLEKVRALLAKAESTTFPEEAEALSAKAQELMARHAIDEAMVGAAAGVDDAPSGLRLPVDDPYARAKSILLSVVASANRCRAVWFEGLGFSTVVGFEADLEFVEVLYTSLLVQATSAMVAAGSQVDRSGRSRTRSFRQSFLLAYAARIGQRLREAEAAGRAEAAEAYGEALLPVLAGRQAAVDAARDAAFPHTVSRSVSASNAGGWAAGSAAADLASLSGRSEVRASG